MTLTATPTAAAQLIRWATPVPEIGPAVYRLTQAPAEHKHAYHIYCPWSPDGSRLLLLRYDRENPEAEVCVLDTASGAIRPIGRSRRWNAHEAACQQWQGMRDRIVYRSAEGPVGVIVAVDPDGANAVTWPLGDGGHHVFCAPDGRWAYGTTALSHLFPGDAIAPRHDKGLFRIDLGTGERQLILPVERALALVPDAAAIASCHLYLKMIILHPRRPRLLCNLTNTSWDRDGVEPRIRHILSVGTDGSDPAYIGQILHHPNWHPIEDLIVANVLDCNGLVRFGLYGGHGGVPLDYVPVLRGSGHPSFSPDGRWLCTDGAGPRGNRIVLCDLRAGREIVAVERDSAAGGGYASAKAIRDRRPGESVTDALAKVAAGKVKTWQTQAHAAWSRDGSAILFNQDTGQGSQLYIVDVERTLAGA